MTALVATKSEFNASGKRSSNGVLDAVGDV
jgi:hypothetical protein